MSRLACESAKTGTSGQTIECPEPPCHLSPVSNRALDVQFEGIPVVNDETRLRPAGVILAPAQHRIEIGEHLLVGRAQMVGPSAVDDQAEQGGRVRFVHWVERADDIVCAAEQFEPGPLVQATPGALKSAPRRALDLGRVEFEFVGISVVGQRFLKRGGETLLEAPSIPLGDSQPGENEVRAAAVCPRFVEIKEVRSAFPLSERGGGQAPRLKHRKAVSSTEAVPRSSPPGRTHSLSTRACRHKT